MPERDENTEAERSVRELTDTERVDAAELISDPETRRKFLEAKEREEERKRSRTLSK